MAQFINTKRLNNILEKWLGRDFVFAIFLLFLTFAIYGIFIPFLGFYWDDFPYLWFRHVGGPQEVVRAIGLDRPVLGLFYYLPMSIFGNNPLVWQIFSIFCRWIFALSVYGFLNELWPNAKKSNQLIIFLFLVFPGFTQQWISVIYSHAFLIFALYFFSLNLFIKNVRAGTRKIPTFLLPIGLSLFCMAATEYLVGLETLRPFIIYKIVSEKNPEEQTLEKTKKTIKIWLPYLSAGVAFVFYRLFLASSVLYQPKEAETLVSDPFLSFETLIIRQLKNIFTSTISAWGNIFRPLLVLDLSSLVAKLYAAYTIALILFSFVFVYLFYSNIIKRSDRKWIRGNLFGGIVSLFFAGIPFWVVGFYPSINFPADRFFLPLMIGSSAVMLCLMIFISRNKYIFPLLFSLFFSLSASFHFQTADQYRNEWEDLQVFFEQFAWRVPSIDENTLFITDELSLKYYSDNSLTAPLNWIYADELSGNSLPYLINFTKARLGSSLSSLEPGNTITHNYRTLAFKGSTDQMVIFYHQPPGCVHIADPELDPYNPLIPGEIRSAVSDSNLDLINYEPNRTSPFFLHSEPKDTWCYYYEKASLETQFENWEEVARLGDIAFNLPDYPNDASERVPFIEGYAMMGRFEYALELTLLTHEISEEYDPLLCRLWDQLLENISGSEIQKMYFSELDQILNCTGSKKSTLLRIQ